LVKKKNNEEIKKAHINNEEKKEKFEDDLKFDSNEEKSNTTEIENDLEDKNEQESLYAVINIIEDVNIHQNHDANIKSLNFNGKISIENPSLHDRLWDIELNLKNIEGTSLESNQILVRELGNQESNNKKSIDFEILKEPQNLLIIKEFINTSPNAEEILNFHDIETYIINLKDKIEFIGPDEVDLKTEGEKISANELESSSEDEIVEKLEKDAEIEQEKKTETSISNNITNWLKQLKNFRKLWTESESNLQKESEQPESEQKIIALEDLKIEKESELEKETENNNEIKLEKEIHLSSLSENQINESNILSWLEQLKTYRKSKNEKEKDIGEDSFKTVEDGGIEIENINFESYRIALNSINRVIIAIGIRNFYEKTVYNLQIIKNLPLEFENINIIETTVGDTTLEDDKLIWNIEELPPETTIILKFSTDVQVNKLDVVKTGTIKASYKAISSFTGEMKLESFQATTKNKYFIDLIEREDEPDIWDCCLIYINTSDFAVKLLNTDIHAPGDDKRKFIILDTDDLPIIPAGKEWKSKVWVYQSDSYPSFKKKIEFTVIPSFQTDVKGTILIDDINLIIASITGDVSFEALEPVYEGEEIENVIKINSYANTDINATLSIINNGYIPLNELKFEISNFSEYIKPPEFSEIKLSIDENEILLPTEAIIIEENSPLTLKIALSDLRNTEGGMLMPNSKAEVSFPIHAIKPPEDFKFIPEIVFKANTFPQGSEIINIPETEKIPEIKVVHIRRKYRIGKEIIPVGPIGNFQIRIHFENIGNVPLKNIELIEKVQNSFKYSNFSIEPKIISDEKEVDILMWLLEKVDVNEKIEITYDIQGEGEYSPKDFQMTF